MRAHPPAPTWAPYRRQSAVAPPRCSAASSPPAASACRGAEMETRGALAGIRVLEFSQIVAGPIVGIQLSDMGAAVIKVEPLAGEARRNSGAVVPNEGKYFQSLNRGKRSLTVDLAR